MNSAVILHKKPGLLVPDLALKKVSVQFPTAFGFAGREGGELKFEVVQKALPLAELNALQTAFKDEHLVMFFANFPKAVLPDDAQPWVMNDTKGNPMVAIFCEGDAKDYVGLNGDHTGEYCASEEIIFPRLLKAGEAAGDDLKKLCEELAKPGLQKVLGGTFNDRGVYVLLPREGEPVMFGDNKLGGAFTWGHMSQTCGYKEEASIPEKVQEVAKSSLSFLRGGGTSATTTPATPAPVEAPKPDAQPGAQPDPVTPATPAIDPKELEAKGYKRMFPPPKLGKGSARNLWLRTFNCIPDKDGKLGQLPSDHQSAQCAVWVQPELIQLSQRTASSQKDVQALATSVHKFRQGKSALGVGGPVTPQKSAAEQDAETVAALARDELVGKAEVEQKPITRSSTREKYVPSANTIGTMSDENKEKAMLRLAGYLDKHRPRPTPLELQKEESKHANFSESTSTTFEERLFLPKEQLFDLFDGNEIAVAYVLEFRQRYLTDTNFDISKVPVPGSFPADDEKPEGQPSVPEVPVPDAQPEQKKSSALSFLRGKAAA